LWLIDPLLSGDSVNSSRCLITAGKHVNNTRAIARQLLGKRVPAATVEVLLDYNSGNGVFYTVRAYVISRVSRVPELIVENGESSVENRQSAG
jgi:hypothetical protein